MDWGSIINRAAREVEMRVNASIARLIQFTEVARSTALGTDDGAAGHATTEASYQKGMRRFQHYGLRSRPPKGTRLIIVHPGGGGEQAASIAEDDQGQGPDDLADGEVAVYGPGGAVIKIDLNGKITIDAPAGQDVVVNGGTLKMARVTDPTTGHLHAAGALMCPNTGTGVPVAITGSTASATDTIASSGGAARFKG